MTKRNWVAATILLIFVAACSLPQPRPVAPGPQVLAPVLENTDNTAQRSEKKTRTLPRTHNTQRAIDQANSGLQQYDKEKQELQGTQP